MSLGARIRKLEQASRKLRKTRQETKVIRTWLCFVIYCSDTPEAERRFGDTLRTGPIFHPSVKAHFESLISEATDWPDP